MNSFVSVVVPTQDRAALLRDALQSLVQQEYPRESYEIVVVDDGSTDDTSRVVQRYTASTAPRVLAVCQAAAGINAARNAGIKSSRGDLICFVDDDVEAPRGWLRAMADGAARHPTAGCLGGPIRLRIESRQRLCGREGVGTALDLGPHDLVGPLLCGSNMAVRRSAVEGVGPFRDDVPVHAGDEVEWEQRLLAAGGTTAYIADAWLWHRRTDADLRLRRSLKAFFTVGRRTVERARVLSEPFSVRHEVAGIPRALGHAVLYRCKWGLLDTSRRIGMAWARLGTLRSP
jgi:glycosyltransferase involved in cell wall biosynthesis